MRPSRMRHLRDSVLPPATVLLAVLVFWQLATMATGVERYLFPSPLDVGSAAWARRATLLSATLLTGLAALLGFVASLTVGVGVAVVFSMSRWLRMGCYPYAIFMQTVPIVAIAPLIVVWCGYGLQSVILVSFIISLFPIITSATTGLTKIDRDLLDLFELHNSSRTQTLLKLSLPASVPFIVSGARISAGMAVIGAIVGEFFLGLGAQRFGLGYLITQTSNQMKTDELFAAVIASAALGVVVFSSIQWCGKTILRRWDG